MIRSLRRYKIGKKVGEGAFGQVFKGVRTGDGAECAIKRIDVSRGAAGDIAKEIKTLGKLR